MGEGSGSSTRRTTGSGENEGWGGRDLQSLDDIFPGGEDEGTCSEKIRGGEVSDSSGTTRRLGENEKGDRTDRAELRLG